jgi:hypothetical protein
MIEYDLLNGEVCREAIPERPEWLSDEPDVVAVLKAYIDKLDKIPLSDRARMPSIRLNRKLTPSLYRHDESADRTWTLLRDLEGQIFELRLNRKRAPLDPEYAGASLRFLDGSESICRAWLSRPRQKRYQEEWVLAVEAYADAFAHGGESLRERSVKVSGKSAAEVVGAFARISRYTCSNLTLRQLSARCFWGHSKVLDPRQDLLHQLYPDLQIAPRPVLVLVHLPETFDGVLFIENLDSYVQALAGRPEAVKGLVLVYGAGFLGSAGRVRTHDGVSLHYHGSAEGISLKRFEAWWFGSQAPAWPVWFWGDLDYSGMAILKALRLRFGDVQAWTAGYAPLVQLLHDGDGHSPDTADKAEQIDPGVTGCAYADQELLPAIRQLGRFVDQEIV